MTKNQLMDLVAIGRARECFEHNGQGIFDITAMRERITVIGTLQCVALDCITPFVRENRVTEETRIVSLPESSWRHDPAICIVIPEPDGTESHLMVDGHHRALRREREGLDDIMIWFVPLRHACRPQPGWGKRPDMDWGDPIINGKIVRRG